MQGLVFRDDLATKNDVALLRVEMDRLRVELKGEINVTVAQAVSEMNRSMRNWMGSVLVAVVGAILGTQLIG